MIGAITHVTELDKCHQDNLFYHHKADQLWLVILWVVWEQLPAAALGASSIAIRKTASAATDASATAASQTYPGMLDGHPETRDIYSFFYSSLDNLDESKTTGKLSIIALLPTFHCTALCHQARRQHPQHLWGRQTPLKTTYTTNFKTNRKWRQSTPLLLIFHFKCISNELFGNHLPSTRCFRSEWYVPQIPVRLIKILTLSSCWILICSCKSDVFEQANV